LQVGQQTMQRSTRLVLLAIAAGAVALAIWLKWFAGAAPPPPRIGRPVPSAAPSAVSDPIWPERPAPLDPARAALATNWPKAPPQFQYSRPASQRGGVEPCAVAAPPEANAIIALSRGHLFMGNEHAVDASGAFDLIMHLHGEVTVRRELVASGQPFVLYTLTLPINESYAPLFAGSGLLGRLIDEVTAAVSKRQGRSTRVRHLALSAWSAGFEGVRSILYQPEAERVEAVLLVDGLHAPRKAKGLVENLEPFVRFARRAAKGERWFVITHSSIPTGGYTSTTESAHFLIHELGGRPTAVQRDDGFGLELVDFFSSGHLHVRGYAGNDKADHCAQLLLMRSLFVALHRYFDR
jgi:hypothetical protein